MPRKITKTPEDIYGNRFTDAEPGFLLLVSNYLFRYVKFDYPLPRNKYIEPGNPPTIQWNITSKPLNKPRIIVQWHQW